MVLYRFASRNLPNISGFTANHRLLSKSAYIEVRHVPSSCARTLGLRLWIALGELTYVRMSFFVWRCPSQEEASRWADPLFDEPYYLSVNKVPTPAKSEAFNLIGLSCHTRRLKYRFNLSSNFMQLSPSWEVASHSATQQFPNIL
jgi:hypothetical protein